MVDFDPGEETANLTSVGSSDIFIQKLSQSNPIGLGKIENDIILTVYPNPSADIFNIKFEKTVENADLVVTNIQGKLISTTQIRNRFMASIEINEAPGIYLLTIKTKAGQKTIELVKE